MAALVGLGLVITEPVATPAEAAGCQSSQIAVVVSFNSLGGGTQTACIGDVGSGLAALSTAGFSYTFVDRQPGLVCTINAAPDPCNGAPTNAYWSYWTASLGGSWGYSNLGAGNRDPAPGSAEGWSFGAGAAPAIGPPAAAAPPPPPPPPPPAPVPGPTPPPGGGSGGGSGGDGSGGSSPGGTVPPPGSPPPGSTEPTEGGTGPDATATDDSDAASGERAERRASARDADALQPASDSTPSGAPWAVVGAIAGLAVLGGAAFWQQRRRRAGPPGTGN